MHVQHLRWQDLIKIGLAPRPASRSIPETFLNLISLERACQIQLKAANAGHNIRSPALEVCEKTARQYAESEGLEYAGFIGESMVK